MKSCGRISEYKSKEHYHSLLKVTTFRVSPSSGKITKLSQKKSHLRRNEKGTCQSTSTNASQLVKKKKKEWNEEIYPIKAPEQKISKSKNHKAAETIPPKKWKTTCWKNQKTKNGRGSGHHEITSFPRSWHHEKTNHAVSVPGPRKPSMKNAAADIYVCSKQK